MTIDYKKNVLITAYYASVNKNMTYYGFTSNRDFIIFLGLLI